MVSKSDPSSSSRSSAPWFLFLQSAIGKKITTGVTGLGLVTFIVIHLLGNLTLFASADAYNRYAYKLEQLAPLVWTVEALLVIGVLLHAAIGIQIYLNKRQARTVNYEAYQSAGKPSHQNSSSRTMIWTGGLLALFIIWHLVTFKFGPHYAIASDDAAIAGIGPRRDLARLVVEAFQQPAYVLSYSLFLGLLGFHLRHGIWSALQSLGLMSNRSSATMTVVGTVGAIAIALGFLVVPWAIYGGWIG